MIIYKATLPNGKCYIGKTIFTLKSRKIQHKSSVNKKKSMMYFHCAIRKHGWNNIVWEIIEDNINDFTYLNEKESFYILKYDTFMPNGYNMTLGGDGTFGYKHSDKTKEKVSLNHHNVKGENNPMFGKVHTKESKEKISKNRIGKYAGKNNGFYDRKHSKETLEKIKEGRKKYEERKKNGI